MIGAFKMSMIMLGTSVAITENKLLSDYQIMMSLDDALRIGQDFADELTVIKIIANEMLPDGCWQVSSNIIGFLREREINQKINKDLEDICSEIKS